MELYLRGTDGKQTVQVDSSGRTRNVLDKVEAQPGKDIFLTIDREMQIKTYNALEQQIANVVVQNLTLKEPSIRKKTTILLKELYGEMFTNTVISMDQLEDSTDGEHQNRIYGAFIKHNDYLLKTINDALIGRNNTYSEETDRYLDYIIDNLVKNGILLTRKTVEEEKDGKIVTTKKVRKSYEEYKNDEISIYEFLNDSIKEESILFDISKKEGERPSNLEIYNYTIDYINNKILNRNAFKRYILKKYGRR